MIPPNFKYIMKSNDVQFGTEDFHGKPASFGRHMDIIMIYVFTSINIGSPVYLNSTLTSFTTTEHNRPLADCGK